MLDPTQRTWRWIKHFPKDTPTHEKYVHFSLKDMLDNFPKMSAGSNRLDDDEVAVKDHVRIGVDTFLVMGKNSGDAKYWTQWCLVCLLPTTGGLCRRD
jgi:hypothetical protein